MPKYEDLKDLGRKELLQYLENNLDLKKIEEIMSKFFGYFELKLIGRESVASRKKMSDIFAKPYRKSRVAEEPCMHVIIKVLEKSRKSKKTEIFKCSATSFGFCQPLFDEGEIFAYVLAYKFRTIPPFAIVSLFEYFVEMILKGTKKGLELDKLYQTVKPRAIALSTVHTVHRLISSSLYLNELLSRIARLSMQIIRTNRCSIKLVDSKKKTLLPKTTVDLRTKRARLKKVKIGKWAPGKSVKYGKTVWGPKYLATPLIDEDVIGVITLYDKVNNQHFDTFDVEIMKTLAEQAAIAIKNAQLFREQEKMTMGSIKVLAQIIAERCPGIYRPKSVFLRMVQLVGQEFGMREYELKSLQYATLLHDAGELMVPDKVLKKRGKLTEEEYRLIKEHPLKGAKIIKSLKLLKPIAPMIMYHHENFDGSGYPKGLKGNEIPLGAKIMAVVSSFEAMITKRSYRAARSISEAVEEIRKNSGRQFDPRVAQVFLKIIKRKDILNLIIKELYGHKKNLK